MTDYLYTPGHTPRQKWRFRRWPLIVIALVALWFGGKAVVSLGHATITVVNNLTGSHIGGDPAQPDQPKIADDPEYAMPARNNNRLDILVLGIRGKGDQDGGLLTDTILLLSLDTKTGAATLTSIPRDLTVRVTNTKTEKINTAYVYNGRDGAKNLYSRILGIPVDNIIVFDLDAFKSIVDTLGGITVTLDKPFSEGQQWSGDQGYTFSLPAGPNTLDGDQALYYVRSRYSSSDFDRSRRQMQVILAIKQKIQALHLTGDPLKALSLITTVRKHIDTDMSIFDLGTLKDLMDEGSQLDHIKRYQLTTDNLLYETMINGSYELLPRDNTLAHIKQFFQTILTSNPILPTPAPADASPHATTLHS